MNLKKSFAVCLSILTFAPFSSHAMKECNIEMSEISGNDEKATLINNSYDNNFENLNINEEIIARSLPKPSAEEEEAHRLGVRNLTCPICLGENNEDEDEEALLSLKCHHVFHQSCLANWTKMMQKKSWKCPVCQDILDPVRDALCQCSVEVEDFDTTKNESENLLNILKNFYISHYILNDKNPEDSLDDIDVCCSTDDIDVGVLYTVSTDENGQITRAPCVLDYFDIIGFDIIGVFRVGSAELRDKFDTLNEQAKKEVKHLTERERISFRTSFFLDFYKNVLMNDQRQIEVRTRQNRRLFYKNLRQCCTECTKCTGLLCANFIASYLLYKQHILTYRPDQSDEAAKNGGEGDYWYEDENQNQDPNENNQNSNNAK